MSKNVNDLRAMLTGTPAQKTLALTAIHIVSRDFGVQSLRLYAYIFEQDNFSSAASCQEAVIMLVFAGNFTN